MNRETLDTICAWLLTISVTLAIIVTIVVCWLLVSPWLGVAVTAAYVGICLWTAYVLEND